MQVIDMKDDFFIADKKRGISVTLVLVAVILVVAVVASVLAYFFVPTVTVDNNGYATPTVDIFSTPTPDSSATPRPSVNTGIYGNESAFVGLYEDNCDSVVILQTSYEGSGSGASSGFIITEDGYILTNSHCVLDATSVEVTLHNGEKYDATIIGCDTDTEVAVIKIEAGKKLDPVTLGDSDKVRVGQYAIAIGNPLRYEYSMSVGIISSTTRKVDLNGRNVTMLQTDAALNSGNSGGPLFNINGEVIGINTLKQPDVYGSSVEGIAFAVPINLALRIARELIELGEVSRPGINITVDAYEYTGNGVTVKEAVAGGAADTAGIKAGDIIVAYNDIPVTDFADLSDLLAESRIGDTVEITVLRGEVTLKFNVVLKKR